MKQEIVQIFAAFAGTFGFSAFLHLDKKKLFPVSLAGSFIWALFLFIKHKSGNEMVALFFASIIASVMAEIFARILKAPSTVFLISILVPLIPGGNLFYTMSHLVLGEGEAFKQYLRLVLWEASSIALGMMVVTSFVHLERQLWNYRIKNKSKR
ncbi:MAG: threonine/serine exporter family protein [Eubacterium sp.]|nr:threonine/serine exporter family protein [Eubacterium sp.]MDD7209048.1 threonine/serine exporter family protein [Lachnospiraceae bacterium]MDY5496438.1 threonine/serine exporter family protein [Anaerobutyricum sp.]